MREALHCVTRARLTLREPTRLAPDTRYSLAPNDLNPVQLTGASRLRLSVGQIIRIVETGPNSPGGPVTVTTVEYFYQLATREDQEILSFHWTPEAAGASMVTFPHLHIGRAPISGQAVLRPDDLHKAHIPTGRISLEAVIHLAITEFQVRPLRRNWEEILRGTEDAFN